MIQQPLHLLKFNYDATTPLVNITLSICPTPPPPVESPDGKSIPSIAEEEPRVVYSGTHGGGFNQVFNLPPESAIDLSSAIAPGNNAGSTLSIGDSDKNLMIHDPTRPGSTLEEGMGNINLSEAGQTDLATVPEVPSGRTNDTQPRGGRRFGLFGRRNRQGDPEQGEIELQNRTEEEKQDGPVEPEKGMRLLIRLEGVGAEGESGEAKRSHVPRPARTDLPLGAPLKRRNAQLTHILISGMWSPDNSSANPIGLAKQIWVVKVVRREALVSITSHCLAPLTSCRLAPTHSSSRRSTVSLRPTSSPNPLRTLQHASPTHTARHQTNVSSVSLHLEMSSCFHVVIW